jgi:cyclopropane-fatty-acyl-phospholipid synthase
MFWPPTELGLAEAYLYDEFDIEGNVETIFGWAEGLVDRVSSWRWRLRIGWELFRLPSRRYQQDGQRGRASMRGSRHSIERDRQAIAYHYDVSNDFYSLWLDKEMVYSCAYFRTGGDDLDTAQEQKLDYICRKLRLSPNLRLLDVGCGWGGLVMHAAAHYGVDQ